MDLITIIIVLVVLAVIMWGVNTYIPLQAGLKKVLNITVVVLVVLWLIKVSGLLEYLRDIKL